MKKRWTALMLALVLALGSSAFAAEDSSFTDTGEIRYPEAVSRMSALGLIGGREDGAFEPKGAVTRAEAARMLTLLLRGGEDLTISADAPALQPAFPDIKGHWAEAYINYCAERGLAFPRESGNFDPDGGLTLFELLRTAEVALGRSPEEFTTAAYWTAVADALAWDRKLYTGLKDQAASLGQPLIDRALTREETAQLLYNTLNATPQTRAGGSGFYEDVKHPDGSTSSLLYESWGLSSWEELEARGPATRPEPAAADPTRFTDAARIGHWEAVAVLCKLEVVKGREDGAFHPEAPVTRAEAARLMVALLSGGKGYDSGVKAEPSFSDIKGHWAQEDIELCRDLGVISGRGDGRFDPEGQVTALELVKMAEGVLGYDPKAYGLTGPRWADRADELARWMSPSLYTGLAGVALNQPVTRDDTAQILYNALQATVKRVVPSPGSDGTVTWEFADAKREDGSPADLLWERFQIGSLEELGGIPVQTKE